MRRKRGKPMSSAQLHHEATMRQQWRDGVSNSAPVPQMAFHPPAAHVPTAMGPGGGGPTAPPPDPSDGIGAVEGMAGS